LTDTKSENPDKKEDINESLGDNNPGQSNPDDEIRIGVYICHCGLNIAGSVDCEEVAKYAWSRTY
jgi:hypothetical protein